jgi:hypothetical protein
MMALAPPAHAGVPTAFGFGTNQPLNVAVKAIAPKGTMVIYGPGVDKNIDVSWHGGAPWTTVMGKLTDDLGLRYQYSGHLLTISEPVTQSAPAGIQSPGLLIMDSASPSAAASPQQYQPLAFSVVGQTSQVPAPSHPENLQDFIFKPHQTTAELNQESLTQVAGQSTLHPSGGAIQSSPLSAPAQPVVKSVNMMPTLKSGPQPLQSASLMANAAPETAPAPLIQSPAQSEQVWRLARDVSIKDGMKQWAHHAGWSLIWLPKNWLVAANTVFVGSFQDAVRGAIKDMRAQGVDVHAKFYHGNRTLEIGSAAEIIQANKP